MDKKLINLLFYLFNEIVISCYFPLSRNDRLDVLHACNYFTCPVLYNLVAACMSWFYLLSVFCCFLSCCFSHRKFHYYSYYYYYQYRESVLEHPTSPLTHNLISNHRSTYISMVRWIAEALILTLCIFGW